MATKVYLNGKNITVDQTGTAILNIRTDRAMNITLQPFYSTDGTIPEPIFIEFQDTFYTSDKRTERITDVQDSTGASFASYFLLMEYLNGFFSRSSAIVVYNVGSTAENQETIIAQNEVIKTNTAETAKELKVLENIKDEAKTNNKLLGKIYNQE